MDGDDGVDNLTGGGGAVVLVNRLHLHHRRRCNNKTQGKLPVTTKAGLQGEKRIF